MTALSAADQAVLGVELKVCATGELMLHFAHDVQSATLCKVPQDLHYTHDLVADRASLAKRS